MHGFNIYFTQVVMPGFWCACSKVCCRCWNGTGFGVDKLMSQRPASVCFEWISFMFSVVNLVLVCTFHCIYHLFCVYFSYVLFIKFICLIWFYMTLTTWQSKELTFFTIIVIVIFSHTTWWKMKYGNILSKNLFNTGQSLNTAHSKTYIHNHEW
jgi:hypothetical protein